MVAYQVAIQRVIKAFTKRILNDLNALKKIICVSFFLKSKVKIQISIAEVNKIWHFFSALSCKKKSKKFINVDLT